MQTALCAIEDEPASFPLLDGGAGALLGQEAVTGACRQLHVNTLVQAMTSSLYEPP